jgi:hypothetical protein
MKKTRLIVFILCLITPLLAKAQEPFIRHFTTKEGLPQQQVMCYFKDSRGFLWIGTKGGLSRFDGKTFENYNEKDGIMHNQIRSIGEDEKGNIWISLLNGLMCFDGKIFKPFPKPSLGDASITVINSRKIIIHSQDWVLFENEQFISKAEYFKGINTTNIIKTHYDKPTGNMYVGYGKTDSTVIHLYQNGQLKKISPPNLDFSDIQRLPNGDLLFGRFIPKMEKGVVTKFTEYQVYKQNTDSTFKLLSKKNPHSFELFDSLPYDVLKGYTLEKEQFFIPKGQKGIFKPMVNPIPTARFNLGGDYEIRSCNFYTNELGNIWVESEQGLWQVFNDAFESIKNKDLNNVWAITTDKQRNLYFATLTTASIIKYNGQQFKSIFDGKSNNNPLPVIAFYYSASTDNKNNLYFPHHTGILKYDGQRFSQITTVDTTTDKNYYICSFYDEKRNWLIGGTDSHIKIFDLSKNTTQIITPKQGLNHNVTGFVKDTDESLWLLGDDAISCWQPEAQRFKTYDITNDRGVKDGGIAGCIDARGTLWIGNLSGLCYFDRPKDALQWLIPEFKYIVNTIINYDKDHLILATTNGLIYLLDLKEWYNHKKVSLKLFNDANGYLGSKVHLNGIFKDAKGIFWILSGTDVVKLYPEKLNAAQGELPKAYINQIDTLKFNLNHTTDTIALKHGQNYFNLNMGFIFFAPSVKTYFSYRLKKQNEENWSAWMEETNHLFTDLASGVYTLEIKARPLGYEETTVDSIFIKVDLPLWKEPWFWKLVLGGVCLFVSIILFLLFRNWYLGRQLQKNIESVRRLEVQTLQAQMNPHFVYNILGSLQNVIYQNDAKAAEFLLLRLSKLIRSFLEASVKSSNAHNFNTQNDTTLQEEIDLLTLYIEFEQFVRKDKFTYTITVADDIDVNNYTLPPIIIQPFVENAIKHGIFYKQGKGHIALNFLKQDEDTLICTIIDDGVGVEQAKAMQAQSIKSYKSLSTQLILDRIERLNLMGYAIEVTTEQREEGGTKVRIVFGYAKD